MKRITKLNSRFNRLSSSQQRRLLFAGALAFGMLLLISIWFQQPLKLVNPARINSHLGEGSSPRLADSIRKKITDSLTHQFRRYGK